MRRKTSKSFIPAAVIVAGLVMLSWLIGPGSSQARAYRESAMRTDLLTKTELIRNGAFDDGMTAWATNPIGTHVGAYGKNGPGVQIWPEFSNNYGYIFQEVYLPTQITAATLSFDYRFEPQSGAVFSGFRARLITENSDLSTPLYVTAYPGGDWQVLNASLSASDVAALQNARNDKKPVYLMIDLSSQFLYADVDNISLKVDGSMTYPAFTGSIAYIGSDSSGYAKTVKRIDPDGGNRQTLWTHPSTIPETNAIYDVAWKPDATELAFSSNHESGYSAFHSDVYGIKPDASGLRRITNPPSKAEIDAGGYQVGAVTGKVHNNYGYVTIFQLYIEGAKEPVSVNIGNYNDETGFTVPNVAALAGGLHYAVFTWAGGNNANCKEYAATALLYVIPGGTVDAGTLTFDGTCGTYNSSSISWKRDGAEVGVDVITPKKFLATGESIGRDLFNAPLTAGNLAWSPMDDRILYRNWIVSGNSGIYLTTAGGGSGSWLVNEGSATWVTPAWLPDGSGFVYTSDNYIYQYNFSSSQSVTLTQFYNEYAMNPSVSPDGNYIVFQRDSTGTTPHSDLWIMNRNNPTEMWALTSDGRSGNPDWSRQNPTSATPTPTATPTQTPAPGVTPTSTPTPTPGATPPTQSVYLPDVMR